MQTNNEVNIFQLFNILFKGKFIIFLTSMIFFILSTIYFFYQNQNSDYTASKKIVRHSLENHNMLSLFKITQNFSNTILNTNIEDKYIKSMHFKTKNIIKLFNDNLHNEESFKYAISNLDITDNEINNIDYKINSNDPDISGTDIIITYKNDHYFESIISNMINYAIKKTQENIKNIVENDKSYVINHLNEMKENQLKKDSVKISKLNYKLSQLKYYKKLAEELNIEYPLNQNIHKVYLDFTNEYVRGFRALEIEINNLEKIIENESTFEKENDLMHLLDNDNKFISFDDKIETLISHKEEHNMIINGFVPVDINNKINIIRNTSHDLTKNGVISILLGAIFGIIIVLFQYSIQKN